MTYHFIINPTAGKGEKQIALLEQIRETCTQLNLDYWVHVSEFSEHAIDIAREICENHAKARIYACGGDGTLNEVCVGVAAHKHIEVGCLPCGSGNDFIRNFGDKDFLDINRQLTSDSQLIDIMNVYDGEKMRHSINAISIGFDSEVAMRMSQYKHIPFVTGSMSYIISIIFSLGKLKGTDIVMDIDGQIVDGKFLLSIIGNGGFYGGGFNGAPLAKLDDGLMDIVAINDVSILKVPKLIGLYKNGAHREPDLPEFKNVLNSYKSKKLKISSKQKLPITVDGEGFYANELEIETIEKVFRFIVPD